MQAIATMRAIARLPTELTRQRTRAMCGRSTSDGGWIFGHLLDGVGGSVPVKPWDVSAVKQARNGPGAWVHLDFRSPRAQDFIASCARERGRMYEIKRQTHVSSLMTADPRKTQPRCDVPNGSVGSMLLTLQVHFGKRFEVDDEITNIVPFRMCTPPSSFMALPHLVALNEDG